MDKAAEEKYSELYRQHNELLKQMAALLAEQGQMEVEDYPLTDHAENTIKLSEVFGDHDQRVLVHNMGKHCNYCTLWAEGFKGVWRHIESGEYGHKAAFVLLNNDTPAQQKTFAAERGWDFPMYSARGTTLFKDLGFEAEQDGKIHYLPGVSALVKGAGGKLRRVAMDIFGPGDMYCSVFHLFDLFTMQEQAHGA